MSQSILAVADIGHRCGLPSGIPIESIASPFRRTRQAVLLLLWCESLVTALRSWAVFYSHVTYMSTRHVRIFPIVTCLSNNWPTQIFL